METPPCKSSATPSPYTFVEQFQLAKFLYRYAAAQKDKFSFRNTAKRDEKEC
jgi:hypothetical protein